MADKPVIMTTTLWDFPSQQYGDEKQGDKNYTGATPAYVIWNLLQKYTKPKDLVIDPMAGSGTTLDVARDLGRRALGYDLQPTRPDIFRCDARKLPLEDGKADCVFIDPPYSTHVKYSGDPRCIGELDAEGPEYNKAMGLVIADIDRILRPGGHVGLYVCDSFKKGRPLIPIGFDLFAMLRKRFEPVDIVAVVRRNKTLLKRNFHDEAAAGNFMLRGFNYLFVMRKPSTAKPARGKGVRRRMIPRALRNQLYWPGVRNGALAVMALAILIYIGSRRLRDFDPPLAGYAFASLFAAFGLTYRYSVWLSKPPTRRFWRRGWQMFFAPPMWRGLRTPRLLAALLWTRIFWQGFVIRRGFWRWAGHMLIAWGCILAAAITFPLVFGWIHFEQARIVPEPTFSVIFFGLNVQELPLTGLASWLAFHGLIISSFLVLPGVMIAMYRRMADTGAVAVQRFGRDFLPLILLFLIAASGLMLWASYEFMDGYFYSVLAQFHALTVIGTLIYLPFGKLFHIFQRPAQLGVEFFRAANEDLPAAECPVTGEAFAPRMQIDDLKEVLREMEFDYAPGSAAPSAPAGGNRDWQEISPRGRRMLIGRAHSKLRDGKFD